MSDSKWSSLVELAQTYFWRAEIEERHAYAFLTVLEALELVDEMTGVAIYDLLQDVFPEESKKTSGDCNTKLKNVEDSSNGKEQGAQLDLGRLDS